jgi:hypothetical protein
VCAFPFQKHFVGVRVRGFVYLGVTVGAKKNEILERSSLCRAQSCISPRSIVAGSEYMREFANMNIDHTLINKDWEVALWVLAVAGGRGKKP